VLCLVAGGLALWNDSFIMNGPDVVGYQARPVRTAMIGLTAVMVCSGDSIAAWIPSPNESPVRAIAGKWQFSPTANCHSPALCARPGSRMITAPQPNRQSPDLRSGMLQRSDGACKMAPDAGQSRVDSPAVYTSAGLRIVGAAHGPARRRAPPLPTDLPSLRIRLDRRPRGPPGVTHRPA
jgi:hypothetical protein